MPMPMPMPVPTPAAALAPAVPLPWWRVDAMLFFVGALGTVVVGSFVLLALAIVYGDSVDPTAATNAARVSVPNTAASPALQARNHAATPAR